VAELSLEKGGLAMAKKSREMEVAVAEVVDYLKITGQFEPALREVVVRKITAEKARESGLKIANQNLQKAADAFRMIHGLNRASQTEAWLKGNGITLEALEAYLETNLLISAFKDSLVKKTTKTKLYNSKPVKETVREIVYQNWLNKTVD
jgi:hypothetical protein